MFHAFAFAGIEIFTSTESAFWALLAEFAMHTKFCTTSFADHRRSNQYSQGIDVPGSQKQWPVRPSKKFSLHQTEQTRKIEQHFFAKVFAENSFAVAYPALRDRVVAMQIKLSKNWNSEKTGI